MTFLEKIRSHPEVSFRYFICLSYSIGALLHLLDIFNLRLAFVEMDTEHKVWVAFLFIGDLATSLTILRYPRLGLVLFQFIALTQLFVYTQYERDFGRQPFLVVFHILSLLTYWKIIIHKKKKEINS